MESIFYIPRRTSSARDLAPPAPASTLTERMLVRLGKIRHTLTLRGIGLGFPGRETSMDVCSCVLSEPGPFASTSSVRDIIAARDVSCVSREIDCGSTKLKHVARGRRKRASTYARTHAPTACVPVLLGCLTLECSLQYTIKSTPSPISLPGYVVTHLIQYSTLYSIALYRAPLHPPATSN